MFQSAGQILTYFFLNFIESYSLQVKIMYCSIQGILNVVAYLTLINVT